MSNKLSGINALSYMGVNATTPPQMITSKVDPTDRDFHGQAVGTLWLNEDPITKKLWVLLDASLRGTNRWGQIYPEASGGTSYFIAESGTATAQNSILKVLGDLNVATSGSGDTLTIGLASDIDISGTLTVGYLGGHDGIVRSTVTGATYSLADSTTNGQVLISSATGNPVWASLTAGANVSITPGPNTITISSGGGGGGSLTFSGDTGTAAANAGSMAIDGDAGNITTVASGTGATAKVKISMAASPNFTTVTATDLTLSGFSEGVLRCDSSGVVASAAGDDGELLIGATGGQSVWTTLTEGNNISITNAANSITIASDAAFSADTGSASMTTGTFKFLGDSGNITTAATTPLGGPQIAISMASSPSFAGKVTAGTGLTITTGDLKVSAQGAGVVLSDSVGKYAASNPGVDGKILISSSLAAPAWAKLTAGANVSITEGPGSITIASGGGGGGSLTFTADGATSTTASVGTINLAGDGSNITTTASGTGASAKVEVSLTSSPDFSDVNTVNLEVSGQPTFTNIGAGLIVSDITGVLSSSTPSADGQLLIGSSTGTFAWNTLTAGTGIGVSNTSEHISISTNAPTSFTGTTGSAAPTGSLKILGDLGNITTTASGTGATSQVVVQMAASPTFTTTSTTNLTVSGFTAGVLKSNGSGVISSYAPTADNQLLVGASTGATTWETLTASTGIEIANSGTALTLTSTTVGINNQTDSYVLALTDAGKLVTMTKATANTLTVPKNSVVQFPIGTCIMVYQGGAGQTTIAPVDGTVTLHSAGAFLGLFAQYSTALLVKIATDTWSVSGDLA